ncbi:hypothetical protein [Corynebacterium meitnerae]|uniref:DIP2116-like N-terminal domain-containing protein n=1 Tax=Corynebacterium meitnerae TaxID=2913498 RepID=A0A9X3LW05_9CORY|nr:hypothetical protein [Corynebacterium meitnerae]MCZ9293818.1 hypothetical protein [Corynebacterium meitnerae]
MKSLRINRTVAAGAAAASLLFTATAVAIPHAGAEAASKDLALKCEYTAPVVGTKSVETTAKVTVDMPKEVDAGADIPVKVTTGDARISSLAFGAVKVNGAKKSTVRLNVSPNAELVGTPAGVTLNNGVLSVSNALSASKTAKQVITVTAKDAEFTLRSKDGEKVTVSAPANIIELTMDTSLGDVPTKCATTGTALNETTVKAAPAPEPQPEPNPEDPAPGDNEEPGENPGGNPDTGGNPGTGDTPDGDNPEPEPQGSSKEDFLAFIFQIFGINKSDEAKQTAISFWSALIGGGILGALIAALTKHL